MEQIDYTSPDFWAKAPEGATHWGPSNGRYDEAWFIMVGGEVRRFMRAEEHEWRVYSREMSADRREQLVARPRTWKGTGLPPVGTVCEMCDDEGAWHRSTVIANGVDRGVPTAIGQADDTLLYCQEGHHCRPLRTPEQVASEERDKARTEVLNAMTEAGAADESQILWAQRIKVVGEMLDMGFRKIDTSQPSPAEISSDIKQANLNLLAEKVLAVSVARRLTAGGNAEVSLHGLIELVALAKELKQ